MLNYFNFKKYNNGYMLLTNDFGEYAFVKNNDFIKLLKTRNLLDKNKYEEMLDKRFILEGVDEDYNDFPNAKKYLFNGTNLHIFVVTNRCNSNCIYCQAKAKHSNVFDHMTKEIAKHSVDIALQSPEKILTFEFQGGEPLLNFDVIKYIVSYANEMKGFHKINYCIVSNLLLLTEEMLSWFIENNVAISTSLDGNEMLHNQNRPLISGYGSYEKTISGFNLIRNKNYPIGAIQTTTRYSLDNYKGIVDEYISNGIDSIFIRPLTPLGTAKETWDLIGYTPSQFEEFYRKILSYIIRKNKDGIVIKEGHSVIF